MKKVTWSHILAIVIGTLSTIFNSCYRDCGCPNHLEKLVGEIFPYSEGDVVEFINSKSVSKIDTVIIYYGPPENPSCSQSRYKCSGVYSLNLGAFYIRYIQSDNVSGNIVVKFTGFQEYGFTLIDTINYTFNNIEYEAEYYRIYDTTISDNYYDCYLTLDNKLLEYRIRDNGEFETWWLVEE